MPPKRYCSDRSEQYPTPLQKAGAGCTGYFGPSPSTVAVLIERKHNSWKRAPRYVHNDFRAHDDRSIPCTCARLSAHPHFAEPRTESLSRPATPLLRSASASRGRRRCARAASLSAHRPRPGRRRRLGCSHNTSERRRALGGRRKESTTRASACRRARAGWRQIRRVESARELVWVRRRERSRINHRGVEAKLVRPWRMVLERATDTYFRVGLQQG